MKTCNLVLSELHLNSSCEDTAKGARIVTHCLYPSFERVAVYVRRHLDGFEVTDAGEALASSWLHGRDYPVARRAAKRASEHFGCEFERDEIVLRAPSPEWLSQAVVSVANAAAEAAQSAVDKQSVSTEQKLVSRIKSSVEGSPSGFEAVPEYSLVGKSGKTHRFDLLIKHLDLSILVEAVVPHPTSIAAKYLALADTEAGLGVYKYAIYDRELPREDKALLSNVADVLPVDTVVKTQGRALLVH